MGHVTFIHGMLNKPAPEELLQLWRQGLAADEGFDLTTQGVSSSQVYWADVFYDQPLADSAAHERLDIAFELVRGRNLADRLHRLQVHLVAHRRRRTLFRDFLDDQAGCHQIQPEAPILLRDPYRPQPGVAQRVQGRLRKLRLLVDLRGAWPDVAGA